MNAVDPNYFNSEKIREQSLRSDSESECISLIQIAGWDLLTKYLNGGLGRIWWCYPFKLGVSSVLQVMAKSLVEKWQIYSIRFDKKNPMEGLRDNAKVESVLCRHYHFLPTALKGFSDRKTVCILQNESLSVVNNKIILKMVESIGKLRPFLLSYWFHGSIGSGDVKSGWSDVDGLAIVSSETLISPEKLRQLRSGLIQARSHMVDFMPYQLHGHFILAETDLISFPSSMFPSVLFKNAKCVVATKHDLFLCERFDRRMALEMLWKHGVDDLLGNCDLSGGGTLRQIVFLHRVFLLPSLVFQAFNKPCFKKDSFERLSEIFSAEEIKVFESASKIWSEWQPPPQYIRRIFILTSLFKFNPLLHQVMTHKLGKRVAWFSRSSSLQWDNLAREMSTIAENVWQRTLTESSDD